MREAKRRYECKVTEIDNGQQQAFESKLAEALAEMRAQQEDQIRLYKEELKRTYDSKVRLDAAGDAALLTPRLVETVTQLSRFSFVCSCFAFR